MDLRDTNGLKSTTWATKYRQRIRLEAIEVKRQMHCSRLTNCHGKKNIAHKTLQTLIELLEAEG